MISNELSEFIIQELKIFRYIFPGYAETNHAGVRSCYILKWIPLLRLPRAPTKVISMDTSILGKVEYNV